MGNINFFKPYIIYIGNQYWCGLKGGAGFLGENMREAYLSWLCARNTLNFRDAIFLHSIKAGA